MLHHVSIGVMNVERAARFYDGVLAALGYRRLMEFMPYGIGYGADTPAFWVQLPHNQSPATMGNGVHVAFVAATKDMIGAFHRAALEAGGVDEGPPGPRPDYGPDYYGAFVRDLDGNKLEAVLVAEASAAPKPKRGAARRTPRKAAKRKSAKRRAAKRKPRVTAARSKRKAKKRTKARARRRR
jgi:catechol 2,3-dioxygenase-like lactoylglutathione lyase family enzyme